MPAEKNIRAFLAIEPSEDVLQTMVRLQEKLKREISGKVSWTRPQGQHLTLKFFGDISTDDVKNISAAVQNRIAPGWSLNLKIEKPGVFPDARKPRVLWC
ncbi:MAG: RNA 2',3'-cyclic phosphodiesterase, partial [Smithella sp.]